MTSLAIPLGYHPGNPPGLSTQDTSLASPGYPSWLPLCYPQGCPQQTLKLPATPKLPPKPFINPNAISRFCPTFFFCFFLLLPNYLLIDHWQAAIKSTTLLKLDKANHCKNLSSFQTSFKDRVIRLYFLVCNFFLG